MKRAVPAIAALVLSLILVAVILWARDPYGPKADEDLSALTDDEIAELVIAYLHEMVDAGEPVIEDCDALAEALLGVQERHRALLEIMSEYHNDPDKRAWFDEYYGDRVEGLGMWMHLEVVPRCGEHEGIQRVLDAQR